MKGGGELKDKILNNLQRLSRAMFIPVLVIPIVGLLIALGNILTHPMLLEFLPFMDNPITTGFGTILSESLLTLLRHLGIIFSVGIGVGLANKKRAEAGFTTFIAYFIFVYAMHAFMDLNSLLVQAENLVGSGQTRIFGVQVFDIGIIFGILFGMLVAFIHNRFANIEFKGVFQIYGGTRFVFILLIPITILLAMASTYIWPVVEEGILTLGSWIHQTGNLGIFIYGTLERLLISTGLHHLVTIPMLYSPLGGMEEVGGVLFEGARNIYLAELTDPTVDVLSRSVIWDARGISKMFGLIGACLAMYHTAKPENKARARTLLIPAALSSLIAGVTEPIEFSFLIVAPILFGLHAVLSGLSMVMLNVLDVRTIGPSGLIDFVVYNLPLGIEKTRWPLFILVGLLFFGLYYVIFRFAIQRFNLKTIGREDNPKETRLYSKDDYETMQKEERSDSAPPGEMKDKADEALGHAPIIVDALGGAENINTITNCYSRLRLTVKDPDRVDESRLKEETGASGVVIKNENVHVVYGLQVNEIRRNVEQYLGRDADKD